MYLRLVQAALKIGERDLHTRQNLEQQNDTVRSECASSKMLIIFVWPFLYSCLYSSAFECFLDRTHSCYHCTRYIVATSIAYSYEQNMEIYFEIELLASGTSSAAVFNGGKREETLYE